MPRFANICFSERSFPVVCDPGDLDLGISDFCVVALEPAREEVGYVKSFEYWSEEQAKGKEIPKILRRGVSKDVRSWHFLKAREAEAIAVCKAKAAKFNLEMKISSVRFDDTQRKICFNFTADKRIDFRELVRELATTFRARIELWQIGVRDEARQFSGMGICGRKLCCSAWMSNFTPVSIRYAKLQDIQFSPSKLSGNCGRLRCCLAFEQEQYAEFNKGAPKIGSTVTLNGTEEVRVIDRNLLSRTITVVDGKGPSKVVSFDQIGLKNIPGGDDYEAAEENFEEEAYPEETPPRSASPRTPLPSRCALEDSHPEGACEKACETCGAEQVAAGDPEPYAAPNRSFAPETREDRKNDRDRSSSRRRRGRQRNRPGEKPAAENSPDSRSFSGQKNKNRPPRNRETTESSNRGSGDEGASAKRNRRPRGRRGGNGKKPNPSGAPNSD